MRVRVFFHKPALWQEDVVDSSQLDIDLQAEVGESLRCCLLNIFHLHTLCGHAEYGVSNTLHFGCTHTKNSSINLT